MSVHIHIHEYFALPQIGQQAIQIGIQGGLANTAFDALVMVTLKAIVSPACGSVLAWSALPPPMFIEATLGTSLAPAASGLERQLEATIAAAMPVVKPAAGTYTFLTVYGREKGRSAILAGSLMPGLHVDQARNMHDARQIKERLSDQSPVGFVGIDQCACRAASGL